MLWQLAHSAREQWGRGKGGFESTLLGSADIINRAVTSNPGRESCQLVLGDFACQQRRIDDEIVSNDANV